jgi:hypothetical protein
LRHPPQIRFGRNLDGYGLSTFDIRGLDDACRNVHTGYRRRDIHE